MTANNTEVNILFLDKKTVDSLLDFPMVVKAVEETFLADGHGRLTVEPVEPMPVGEKGGLLAMPSYLPDLGVAGVKWLGYFRREVGSSLPASWGNILILNHDETGLPFAILDCTSITAYRTAGGHAVAGAKQLAKKNSRVLGVLGSGAQGYAGIRSFDQAFDLSLIKVYARTKASREECQRALAPELRATLQAVDTPEELVRDADILLTASSSREIVIKAEWIPAGCTVTAVSAFGDLDPAFSKSADQWFIGQSKADGAHIVHSPRYAGQLDEADVKGTLGELLTGKVPGRTNEEERILFSHMGMGALDVAVGKVVYERAVAGGLGLRLRLA